MSPKQSRAKFAAEQDRARLAAATSATPRFGRIDADLADVESSIHRSREYILSRQHPDGYWCGELEADSMLEADYIFLHTLLESACCEPARR